MAARTEVRVDGEPMARPASRPASRLVYDLAPHWRTAIAAILAVQVPLLYVTRVGAATWPPPTWTQSLELAPGVAFSGTAALVVHAAAWVMGLALSVSGTHRLARQDAIGGAADRAAWISAFLPVTLLFQADPIAAAGVGAAIYSLLFARRGYGGFAGLSIAAAVLVFPPAALLWPLLAIAWAACGTRHQSTMAGTAALVVTPLILALRLLGSNAEGVSEWGLVIWSAIVGADSFVLPWDGAIALWNAGDASSLWTLAPLLLVFAPGHGGAKLERAALALILAAALSLPDPEARVALCALGVFAPLFAGTLLDKHRQLDPIWASLGVYALVLTSG